MDHQRKQARIVPQGTNDQAQIFPFRTRCVKIQLSGKGCCAGKEEKMMTGRVDGLSYSSCGGPIRRLEGPSWGQILLEKLSTCGVN